MIDHFSVSEYAFCQSAISHDPIPPFCLDTFIAMFFTGLDCLPLPFVSEKRERSEKLRNETQRYDIPVSLSANWVLSVLFLRRVIVLERP